MTDCVVIVQEAAEQEAAKCYTTYFYVFVSSRPTDQRISDEPPQPPELLDHIVASAFDRFQGEFTAEAKVQINPENYHDLRKGFGIKTLPAFGVSDIELSDKELLDKLPDLPPWWNLFKLEKRRELLRSEKVFPRVERRILEVYSKDLDKLFHFIRDLHIENMDGGLSAVQKKIESELKRLDIKDIGELIGGAKKVFVR